MADRKLTVELSDDAYEGWKVAASVYGGGRMASLVEVIGLALLELDGPIEQLPKHWRTLLREAALLDAERRRNQGRRRA